MIFNGAKRYHPEHVSVFEQWCSQPESRDADGTIRVNMFDRIPTGGGVDVLLTHGPPCTPTPQYVTVFAF